MKLFSTERTDVYLLTEDLAEKFQHFLVTNKAKLAPFEPLRDDQYFILKTSRNELRFH